MPEFPVLSFSFSRLKQSKHTKTSRKSFKALPEAVTGAPAFGFREVFCVSGNAMIHTIPYDIRLCMQQPMHAAALFRHGKKKEQAGGKGMASGGHPFPFARNLWSLCISPCSVYNNNDEE